MTRSPGANALPVLPLHNAPAQESLRVAIITENFLPKVDGSTITIANILQHLKTTGVQAMLFGPDSGMSEYAGAKLFGTYGVPLRVYPGLKINFISPSFIRALREFDAHVIHLVDPLWLGVQALAAIALLFPTVPVVTSHHTNLPTYAAIFGYPYYLHRTWQVHAYFHSFARCTMVPSASTAGLLAERGFINLRVVSRGVDFSIFDPSLRSESMRQAWIAAASAFPPSHLPSTHSSSASTSTISTYSAPGDQVIILSVGRLSPEKNLILLIDALAALPPSLAQRSTLIFIGDGPFRAALHAYCAARGIRAVFTGHLSGRALGVAFASGDILCAPSVTETFGQTTLQGMAAGVPVVGLLAEGTADLVDHGRTGLLLDLLAAAEGRAPWSPVIPLAPGARVVGWNEAAPLLADDDMSLGSSARANIVARFACLLEVLIEDGERRRAMGTAAADAARSGLYEWEACASRVVAAYGEAVGVTGPASLSGLPAGDAKPAPPALDIKLFPATTSTLVIKRPATIRWSLPPPIQFLVDGAVVLHSLGLALASHLLYMVPSGRDVSERVGWLVGRRRG
ncbi:hypothetical protein C8F01DRAFT_1145288 [Mycena amicta]|nr:hypothetical protein C8F01DRAFT_1145288 [Mycena amicta]